MARRRRKTSSAISWWHDIKADYTRFKKWNAKRIKANNVMAKERAKASAESAQAKLERDQRRAKSRADADRRKTERAAQARNRKAAAEERAQRTAARPQVVKARVVTTPATPAARVPTAQKAAARPTREAIAAGATQQCGARCDDGTPCQNPTVGGPCAAGHTPKGSRRQVSVTISGTGRYGPDGSIGTVIGNVPKIRRPAKRDHDGLGRPLNDESREFFRLRDEEGYKGPIRWDRGTMPYKVDEQGKRRA